MTITQSDIDAALCRYDDFLTASARDRLITAAIQHAPSAAPWPVDRLRAGLRHAVAMLIALAALN